MSEPSKRERKVLRLKDEFDEGSRVDEIEAFLKLYRLALKMARLLDRLYPLEGR